MTRPLRLEVPDGTYHVTARGNAKQPIFNDDADCHGFLRVLDEVLSRFGWRCLAYCLMNNHYHLVVVTPRADLAAGIRHLNGVYAQRFNRRHDRCGHLFQGRYHAVLIERDAHMLELARYVALNPVRSGFCPRPEDWRWSSHRAVLGIEPPGRVDVDGLLAHFEDGRPGTGRRRYREFVRDADQVIAGSAEFLETHLPAAAPSPEVPRRHWQPVRPPLEEIVKHYERDEAIALAYRKFGYRMVEIARAIGCHYVTVSRRLRAWEAAEMS